MSDLKSGKSDLKNELSWSASRDRALKECARAYYWSYYGSWGGWDGEAPEDARLAYRLKRIANMDMWAGDVAHRVIAETLDTVRRGGQLAELEEMRERARFFLNREWFQSKDRAWEENAKRFRNLYEHYYDKPITRDRRHQIREKIFVCLKNFHRSPVLQEILKVPHDGWLVEDLESFEVGGVPVFAKPDLALKHDDEVVIYDWKTGRESDRDRIQMSAYALLAIERYGARPDGLRVVLFYLKSGIVRSGTPSAADLDEIRGKIAESVEGMRGLVTADNEAKREDFALTRSRRACERCHFLELCQEELASLGRPVGRPRAPATAAP